jgi:hypothetical protein
MEDRFGCVIGFGLACLAALGLAALVVDGLARYNDAQASRLYAQAALVTAQGQARLDSAMAFAMTIGALFPWLVVAVVGVAGVALLASIVAMFSLGLAALQGRPATLPRMGRVQVLDRPAALILPGLEGPVQADRAHVIEHEVRR